WWAVKAGCRRWYRRDCGNDENGKPYDYRWVPDPGTLRRVAHGEAWQVKQRIRDLEKVLGAREHIDCREQLERGKLALAGLNTALKAGNLSDAGRMTFEQAIERGSPPPAQAMREAAE